MIGDLVRAARLDDASRLASRTGAPDASRGAPADDPALPERLDDHLRDDRVAHALRLAEQGDAATLRALAPRWIARTARELDAEIADAGSRIEAPAAGWETELARTLDPAVRDRTLGRWREAQAAIEELVEARRALLDTRARRLGARDAAALLAATVPPPVGAELAGRLEREAIAPLDERIAAARLRRERQGGSARLRAGEPADEAARRAAVEERRAASRERVRSVVGRVAAAAGADPDGGGLDVETEPGDRAWSEALDPEGSPPTVVLGGLAGPVALSRALAETGAAIRLGFLRERGPEARVSDPAFEHAARTLWRRVPLAAEARSALGLDWGPAAEAAARLEEALVPRVAWAYVCLAAGIVAAQDSARLLERAGTMAGWPGVTPCGDPLAAGVVRGTVFGLLLEERLLTRYGRLWFADRAALRFLRDVWDAEHGRAADAVAEDLDVGTMDGAPILDRCRPD